jgi:hypothetical protein
MLRTDFEQSVLETCHGRVDVLIASSTGSEECVADAARERVAPQVTGCRIKITAPQTRGAAWAL